MKKLLFLLMFFISFQNNFAQPTQQLDELVIVDKKMKNFKVSKGKKSRRDSFNHDFKNYYYVLDSLPYGYLNKITISYSTNFIASKSSYSKEKEEVYDNWCTSCFFDVDIYDYENGELTKLTTEPIVIGLEKTNKLGVKKIIDFSAYNLIGTQFVMSIIPSSKKQECTNCAIYRILLFVDEKESLFVKDKNKFIFGKGLTYDLEVRSKKY